MKPEDLSKALDYAFERLVNWFSCVRDPKRTCEGIFALSSDSTDAVRRAIPIWLISFLLTLVTTGWVYQLYGIGLGNPSFHVAQGAVLLSMLFATAFSIWAGLRLCGLPAMFGRIFVVWTVYVSSLSPLYSLIVSPTLALHISLLKSIKSANHTFESGLTALVTVPLDQVSSPLNGLAALLTVMLLPFSLIQLGRVLDAIAHLCGLNRTQAIRAGALGLVIATVPSTLLGALYQVLIYSFL